MGQAETKKRTITYLRAAWSEGHDRSKTLQEAIKVCLDIFINASDTRLSFNAGKAEIRHRRIDEKNICLHVATWTDRETISTVPDTTDQPQADLSFQPPGEKWNYLDGDGMLLISDNHCLLMPAHNCLPKTLEKYIRQMLDIASRDNRINLPDWIDNFQLIPIANEENIKKVQEEGIKSIRLNIGLYSETTRAEPSLRSETLIKRLHLGVLKNLITKDEDRIKIEEAENVHANLVIKIDSRRSGLTHEEFKNILNPVIEESPEDFDIETATGQRIKRGELIMKESVEVIKSAKTVDHKDAWQKMQEYLNKLSSSGMLER